MSLGPLDGPSGRDHGVAHDCPVPLDWALLGLPLATRTRTRTFLQWEILVIPRLFLWHFWYFLVSLATFFYYWQGGLTPCYILWPLTSISNAFFLYGLHVMSCFISPRIPNIQGVGSKYQPIFYRSRSTSLTKLHLTSSNSFIRRFCNVPLSYNFVNL